MRQLIINADDFNLTLGVSRGILRAHDEGIVTSTTLLINLPLEETVIREIKKRRNLGAGLHLNVTLGKPVNRPSQVPTLVKEESRFRRPMDYLRKMPSLKEVLLEYEAQVQTFRECFGRLPDHLDTHHHLHDYPLFWKALSSLAEKWKLPVRRSRIFQIKSFNGLLKGVKTTDYLFGNLEARYHWEPKSFWGIVENLPEGTSEIACHPGFCDHNLREISSFREGREAEFKLFSNHTLRRRISDLGIDLIRFNQI